MFSTRFVLCHCDNRFCWKLCKRVKIRKKSSLSGGQACIFSEAICYKWQKAGNNVWNLKSKAITRLSAKYILTSESLKLHQVSLVQESPSWNLGILAKVVWHKCKLILESWNPNQWAGLEDTCASSDIFAQNFLSPMSSFNCHDMSALSSLTPSSLQPTLPSWSLPSEWGWGLCLSTLASFAMTSVIFRSLIAASCHPSSSIYPSLITQCIFTSASDS